MGVLYVFLWTRSVSVQRARVRVCLSLRPGCVFLCVVCLSELQTFHCESQQCLRCRALLTHISALVLMRASGGARRSHG